MNHIIDNYKNVLTHKYAQFNGRATRSEFWYFILVNFIVSLVLGWLGRIGQLVNYVFVLALFIPNIAIGIRRLHDTNKSGWWILLGLIPFLGWIVLIVFYATDSGPENKYGSNPKSGQPTPVSPSAQAPI